MSPPDTADIPDQEKAKIPKVIVLHGDKVDIPPDTAALNGSTLTLDGGEEVALKQALAELARAQSGYQATYEKYQKWVVREQERQALLQQQEQERAAGSVASIEEGNVEEGEGGADVVVSDGVVVDGVVASTLPQESAVDLAPPPLN